MQRFLRVDAALMFPFCALYAKYIYVWKYGYAQHVAKKHGLEQTDDPKIQQYVEEHAVSADELRKVAGSTDLKKMAKPFSASSTKKFVIQTVITNPNELENVLPESPIPARNPAPMTLSTIISQDTDQAESYSKMNEPPRKKRNQDDLPDYPQIGDKIDIDKDGFGPGCEVTTVTFEEKGVAVRVAAPAAGGPNETYTTRFMWIELKPFVRYITK